MNHTRFVIALFVVVAFVIFPHNSADAGSIGTAFTYQGRLIEDNMAADGLYDFQFRLFDAENNGHNLGPNVNKTQIDLIYGYFTVDLDFGGVFDGNELWLQIAVRPHEPNDPGVYTLLSPRQKIMPALYAIHSLDNPQDASNSLDIYPTQNIVEKYNWLKSSDRDEQMGTLSITNRRTLLLRPGTYRVSPDTLVFDANFVDFVAISDNPEDTVVLCNGHGFAAKQIASDIKLKGFTIRNTGIYAGDHTFLIDCNNSPSFYSFMNFRQPNAFNTVKECVRGLQTMAGKWDHCNADRFAWRVTKDANFDAYMWDCNASAFSYGGDQDINLSGTGEINGKFYRCRGVYGCFGGCNGYGMKCSKNSYFEDCVGTDNCWAMGKEFAGTAVRCVGDYNCFGGYSGYFGEVTSFGKFTGVAMDCRTKGGTSFGMGNAHTLVNGSVIRCQLGTDANYSQGVIDSMTLFDAPGPQLSYVSMPAGAVGPDAVFLRNFPWKPTTVTSNFTVHAIYNGHTYQNSGATGPVTCVLSPALPNIEFTFVDANMATGSVFKIDPNGADSIILDDGTELSPGQAILHTENLYGEVTLKCYVATKWYIKQNVGVWHEELP